MKKIIIICFAAMLLLGTVSCSDPYADELYDLKTDPEDEPGGDQSPPLEDNPPPAG